MFSLLDAKEIGDLETQLEVVEKQLVDCSGSLKSEQQKPKMLLSGSADGRSPTMSTPRSVSKMSILCSPFSSRFWPGKRKASSPILNTRSTKACRPSKWQK